MSGDLLNWNCDWMPSSCLPTISPDASSCWIFSCITASLATNLFTSLFNSSFSASSLANASLCCSSASYYIKSFCLVHLLLWNKIKGYYFLYPYHRYSENYNTNLRNTLIDGIKCKLSDFKYQNFIVQLYVLYKIT